MLPVIRDSFNHFVLNKLLTVRYDVRKRSGFFKFAIFFEKLFVKQGLKYYGHRKL
jgi:hypothetical protein